MSTLVRGETFTEEPRRITYSTTNGWETTRSWVGSRADILNWALLLEQYGYSYSIQEGPQWRIEGTIQGKAVDEGLDPLAFTETPPPVWEIVYNTSEKDVLSSREVPIVNALSLDGVEALRNMIRNPVESDKLLVYFKNPIEYKAAIRTFYFMMQGVTSSLVSYPTLRRTLTISTHYIIPPTLLDGVIGQGKIWLTDELIAYENVPAWIQPIMPNPALPAVRDAAYDQTYYYGWIKHHPTAQQVAINRFQLVQEWHYGLWLHWIWGTPQGGFPTFNQAP